MKLIVGLGNPGKEYEKHRHNTGFMCVEYLLHKIDKNTHLQLSKKMNAAIAEVKINNEKYIFAEPQTYMNSSGKAVSQIVHFYKIATEDVIVVHDDLDIQLGGFKIQKGKGPKIHNGILSIEELLGSKDFMRVRVGVDNRSTEQRTPGDAYVLSNFTNEEIKTVKTVFEEISTKV